MASKFPKTGSKNTLNSGSTKQWITYLRNHSILAEYVDLLQGRIPKSVFARHYLKVEDLKQLVSQVFAVTVNLEYSLLS